LERYGRMGVATQDTLDGGGRVEARGDGAAEGLDTRDGFGGGARDDKVDGRSELLGVLPWALAGQCGALHVWERHTLASSLTPWRLTPWMQRDLCSSFMVMGLEGSRRPWSIHDCMRSRLTGDMSTLKLRVRQLPRCLCACACTRSIGTPQGELTDCTCRAPSPGW
jgi:hypothetical protein